MDSIQSHVLSNAEIKALILSIDLTITIKKMVKIHNWNYTSACLVAEQYRNFLFLKKKYGHSHTLPPSLEIDEFWHNHVLNTKKYFEDCNKIFGEYLHHTPHHGLEGEISQSSLEALFENETQKFYFEEFGEYIHTIKVKSLLLIILRYIKKYSTQIKNSIKNLTCKFFNFEKELV